MLTIKFNPAEFHGETRRISANRSTCSNLHLTFPFSAENRFSRRNVAAFRGEIEIVSAQYFFLHGVISCYFSVKKRLLFMEKKIKRGNFFTCTVTISEAAYESFRVPVHGLTYYISFFDKCKLIADINISCNYNYVRDLRQE